MTKRVLVVDDSEAMLVLLHDFLTGEGHTVTTLPTSEHAVAQMRATAPDVILLDIILAPRNGWAVLADLRQAAYRGQVYMMSAGFPVMDAAARLLGATGVISKVGDFLGAVERAVGTVDSPPC